LLQLKGARKREKGTYSCLAWLARSSAQSLETGRSAKTRSPTPAASAGWPNSSSAAGRDTRAETLLSLPFASEEGWVRKGSRKEVGGRRCVTMLRKDFRWCCALFSPSPKTQFHDFRFISWLCRIMSYYVVLFLKNTFCFFITSPLCQGFGKRSESSCREMISLALRRHACQHASFTRLFSEYRMCRVPTEQLKCFVPMMYCSHSLDWHKHNESNCVLCCQDIHPAYTQINALVIGSVL
jgi:hypothetical protein